MSDCHICPNLGMEESFKKLWALKDISQQPSGLWLIRIKLRKFGQEKWGSIYEIHACQECAVKWYGMEVLFAQLKTGTNMD